MATNDLLKTESSWWILGDFCLQRLFSVTHVSYLHFHRHKAGICISNVEVERKRLCLDDGSFLCVFRCYWPGSDSGSWLELAEHHGRWTWWRRHPPGQLQCAPQPRWERETHLWQRLIMRPTPLCQFTTQKNTPTTTCLQFSDSQLEICRAGFRRMWACNILEPVLVPYLKIVLYSPGVIDWCMLELIQPRLKVW